VRFRRLKDDDGSKYLSPARHGPPNVFNREALVAVESSDTCPDRVLVCEGELDALLAHQRGECAVGLPGAMPSRRVMNDLVQAIEHAPLVYLFEDTDDAGERGVQRTVDALVEAHGAEWVKERVRIARGTGDFTDTLLGLDE